MTMARSAAGQASGTLTVPARTREPTAAEIAINRLPVRSETRAQGWFTGPVSGYVILTRTLMDFNPQLAFAGRAESWQIGAVVPAAGSIDRGTARRG
jgi:hypothetical protein